MAAQIDNTDAIQDTLGGRLPKTNVTPVALLARPLMDVTSPSGCSLATNHSFTLNPRNAGEGPLAPAGRSFPTSNLQHPTSSPTLGDGHTVPSENAVTRAASTKVEKLMDTLSDPFRIGILSGATRAKYLSGPTPLLHAVMCSLATAFFIDTHDEQNSRLTSTESARSQNFHRYTFGILRKHKSAKKEACIE